MKLYVGCSLTHSPDTFQAAVEELKRTLRKQFEVFDFLGKTNGSERDVYQWDIQHCVATCDFFLAICDHASLGLGYEIAAAVEKYAKPVLAVAHANTQVSRLILGIDAPAYSFRRYSDLADVSDYVTEAIKQLGLT